MSQFDDEYVLQFRAESGDFDRTLDNSLNILQRFVSGVKGATSQLSGKALGIGNGALSGVSKGLEQDVRNIRNQLNPLGAVINKFKQDMITGFGSGLTQITGMVTGLNQLQSGFTKFDEKTRAIGTLVSQGKNSFEEITDEVEKLNWFSDETSYNFTDMIANVGKFTASGQKLQDATVAIEGIATWAAMSGQNAQKASQAMVQLSQAMSKGALKYDDWRSVQNAQMDTEQFRLTAIQTAIDLKKVEEVAKGVYKVIGDKKGRQWDLGGMFTSDALTQLQWLDTDVMMGTYKKYSESIEQIREYAIKNNVSAGEAIRALGDSLDEFSVKAFQAAQESRTWQDVLDATADAVSTGWSKTYELIFGNYNEAKAFFSGMSEVLYEFMYGIQETRNDIIRAWRGMDEDGNRIDGTIDGRTVLIEGLVNAFNALRHVLAPIGQAFRDVFMGNNGLLNLTLGFKDFTASLIRNQDEMEKAYNRWSIFFKILKGAGAVIGFVISSIAGLLTGTKSLSDIIGEIGIKFDSAASHSKALSSVFDGIKKTFFDVEKAFFKSSNVIDGIKNAFGALKNSVKDALGFNKPVEEMSGFTKAIILFITNTQKAIVFIKKIASVVGVVLAGALGVGIAAVIRLVGVIRSHIPAVTNLFRNLGTMAMGAGGMIVNAFQKIPGQLEKVKTSVSGLWSSFKSKGNNAIWIDGIKNSFGDLSQTIQNKGLAAFRKIGEFFRSLTTSEFKMPTFDDLKNSLQGLWDTIKEIGGKIGDVFGSIFGKKSSGLANLPMQMKEVQTSITGVGIGAGALMTNIGGLQTKFSGFGGVIGWVVDKFEAVKGFFNDITVKVDDFVERMTAANGIFGVIGRTISGFIAKTAGIPWEKILAVAMLFGYIRVVSKFVKVLTKTGKTVDKAGEQVKHFGDWLTGAGKGIAGVLGSLSKSITGFGDSLKSAVETYSKAMIKSMKYDNFRKIAAGVLMLTVAITGLAFALNYIKPENLRNAVIAIGALAAVIAGVTVVMGKASQNIKAPQLASLGVALAGFALAILGVSGAIAIVAKTTKDWDDVGRAVSSIFIVIGTFVALTAAMNVFGGGNAIKGALGLLAFALSLNIALIALAAALNNTWAIDAALNGFKSLFNRLWNYFANANGKQIFKAITAIALAIGGFILVIKTLEVLAYQVGKQMMMAAASLLIMVYAIDKFVKIIKDNGFEQVADSFFALVGAAGALALFVAVISKITGVDDVIEKVSKSCVGLAGSLLILTGALAIMSKLDLGAAAIGGLILIGMMFSLVAAVKVLDGAKVGAAVAGILALVVSLYLLIPAMILLGVIPWKVIARGLVFTAGAILALSGAVALMGKAKFLSLVVGIAGMVAILWELVWVMEAVSALKVTKNQLALIGELIAAMLALALFANIIQDVKMACVVFAASMAILGLGINLMAQGLGQLKGVDLANIIAPLVGIGAFMIEFGVIAKKVDWGQLIAAGVGLAAFALSMGVMVNAMAGLASLDFNNILTVVIGIGALVGVFGLVALINPGKIIAAGIAISAFALTMSVLVGTLAELASVDLTSLQWTMGLIIGLVAVMGLISLTGGGGALVIAAFALAFLTLGYACDKINSSLTNLLPTMEGFITSIHEMNDPMLPGFLLALGAAFIVLGLGCGALGLGLLLLTPFLGDFGAMLDKMKETFDGFVEWVGEVVANIKTGFEDFTGIDISEMSANLTAPIETIKEAWNSFKEWIGGFAQTLSDIWDRITHLDFVGAIDIIKSSLGDTVVGAIEDMAGGLTEIPEKAAEAAVETKDAIVETLSTTASDAAAAAAEVKDGIVENLVAVKDDAAEAVGGVVDSIGTALEGGRQVAEEGIAYVCDGVTAGWENYVVPFGQMLYDGGVYVFGLFKQGAQNEVEVNSPSRWMMWLAQMLGDGFLEEWERQKAKIGDAGGNTFDVFMATIEAEMGKLPSIGETTGGSFLDVITNIFSNIPGIGEEGIMGLINSLSGHNGEMGGAGEGLGAIFGSEFSVAINTWLQSIGLDVSSFVAWIQSLLGGIQAQIGAARAAEAKYAMQQQRRASVVKPGKANINVTDSGTGSAKNVRKALGKETLSDKLGDVIAGDFDPSDFFADLTAGVTEAEDAADDLANSLGSGGAGGAADGAGKSAKDAGKEMDTLAKYTKYAAEAADFYSKSFYKAYEQVGDTVPMEEAQVAIDQLAEAIYQDSLKASGAMEDTSMTAEERSQAVMEAFNKAYEEIKNNVESSIDLFEKFSTSMEDVGDPKQILKNSKSQIDGYASLGAKYIQLSKMGFSDQVIAELEKGGAGAIKKVNTLLMMSADQVNEYNTQMINKSVVASGVASEAMAARAIALQRSQLAAAAATGDAVAAETLKIMDANSAAADMMMKFQVRYETMQGTIEELINSQMNLFEKMELKTEISAEQMLDNMMSQIDGIAQWADECQTLAKRGIDQGLLGELEQLGPEGYEKLHAFVMMSDEQLQQANNLYQASLQLPETASKAVASSYAVAGSGASAEFLRGLYEKQAEVNAGVQQMVTQGEGALSAAVKDGRLHADGQEMSNQVSTGMDSNVGVVEASARNLVDVVHSVFNESGDLTNPEGVNGVDGYKAPFEDPAKLAEVADAAAMPVDAAVNSVRDAQQSHSPSEVFKGLAYDAVDGYIMGLLDEGKLATVGLATQNVVTTGVTALTEAIADGRVTTLGTEFDNQFSTGMLESAELLINPAAAQAAYRGMDGFQQGFANVGVIGQNASIGLANGILAGAGSVIDAAVSVASAASDALASAFEIASPSKLWEQFGEYNDLGLARGLTNFSSVVVAASEDLANDANEMINSPFGWGLEDGSYSPVITPVLDMSNVQNGFDMMDSYFGSDYDLAPNVKPNIEKPRTNADMMNDVSNALNGINGGNTVGDIAITINTQPGQDPQAIADAVSSEIYRRVLSREAVTY